MSQPPHDIWLSGEEHIHLISDLLEPKEISNNEEEFRHTGRSSRLACKYAELAMKLPGTKIIIKDHYNNKSSHYQLTQYVTKILTVLNVDYLVGQIGIVERDDNEFTGNTKSSNAYYVVATPLKQIEVPMPF